MISYIVQLEVVVVEIYKDCSPKEFIYILYSPGTAMSYGFLGPILVPYGKLALPGTNFHEYFPVMTLASSDTEVN